MESFADFFKRTVGTSDGQDVATSALPSPATRLATEGLTFNETISGALATVFTKEGTDITDLYKSAAATVRSESFVDDLSKAIEGPRPTESEDDFVKRAKGVARALLLKRLGG